MTSPIQMLTCVCLACGLIACGGAAIASELRPVFISEEIELPTIHGLEAKIDSYFCPPEPKAGDQPRRDPGATVALTKNIDFYVDWVGWDVYNNANAAMTNGHLEIKNGFSFVINWRF